LWSSVSFSNQYINHSIDLVTVLKEELPVKSILNPFGRLCENGTRLITPTLGLAMPLVRLLLQGSNADVIVACSTPAKQQPGRKFLSVEEHEVIRRVVLALYRFGIYRP
jgi:hypothetical protein